MFRKDCLPDYRQGFARYESLIPPEKTDEFASLRSALKSPNRLALLLKQLRHQYGNVADRILVGYFKVLAKESSSFRMWMISNFECLGFTDDGHHEIVESAVCELVIALCKDSANQWDSGPVLDHLGRFGLTEESLWQLMSHLLCCSPKELWLRKSALHLPPSKEQSFHDQLLLRMQCIPDGRTCLEAYLGSFLEESAKQEYILALLRSRGEEGFSMSWFLEHLGEDFFAKVGQGFQVQEDKKKLISLDPIEAWRHQKQLHLDPNLRRLLVVLVSNQEDGVQTIMNSSSYFDCEDRKDRESVVQLAARCRHDFESLRQTRLGLSLSEKFYSSANAQARLAEEYVKEIGSVFLNLFSNRPPSFFEDLTKKLPSSAGLEASGLLPFCQLLRLVDIKLVDHTYFDGCAGICALPNNYLKTLRQQLLSLSKVNSFSAQLLKEILRVSQLERVIAQYLKKRARGDEKEILEEFLQREVPRFVVSMQMLSSVLSHLLAMQVRVNMYPLVFHERLKTEEQIYLKSCLKVVEVLQFEPYLLGKVLEHYRRFWATWNWRNIFESELEVDWLHSERALCCLPFLMGAEPTKEDFQVLESISEKPFEDVVLHGYHLLTLVEEEDQNRYQAARFLLSLIRFATDSGSSGVIEKAIGAAAMMFFRARSRNVQWALPVFSSPEELEEWCEVVLKYAVKSHFSVQGNQEKLQHLLQTWKYPELLVDYWYQHPDPWHREQFLQWFRALVDGEELEPVCEAPQGFTDAQAARWKQEWHLDIGAIALNATQIQKDVICWCEEHQLILDQVLLRVGDYQTKRRELQKCDLADQTVRNGRMELLGFVRDLRLLVSDGVSDKVVRSLWKRLTVNRKRLDQHNKFSVESLNRLINLFETRKETQKALKHPESYTMNWTVDPKEKWAMLAWKCPRSCMHVLANNSGHNRAILEVVSNVWKGGLSLNRGTELEARSLVKLAEADGRAVLVLEPYYEGRITTVPHRLISAWMITAAKRLARSIGKEVKVVSGWIPEGAVAYMTGKEKEWFSDDVTIKNAPVGCYSEDITQEWYKEARSYTIPKKSLVYYP